VGGLALIGMALPDTYKVERSVEINAPAGRIFAHLNDPRAWAGWTVWNRRDPNMRVEYAGASSGAGAKWSWQSKTEGSGSMEFTSVDAPRLLQYKLFFPDFNSTSTGTITLTCAGIGTRVSWTNAGETGNNPLMRYFGMMMDRMIGPDFEGGLKNLKMLSEQA
jgi:uncharacterized protein YndB with AHSA1/START domain